MLCGLTLYERYANISYDVMQKTLRYMTKLDRAINNKVNLEQLKQFYESAHISANDLFQILKNVRNKKKLIH